jgi:hypothetical protein
MGISHHQLIDIALNIAGALAGGALWLVVLSVLRHRRQPSTARPAAPVPASRPSADRPAEGRRKVEFVSLREAEEAPAAGSYQRNRAEVIRLAREMLKSGSSAQRVQELLPISDGELAMLTGR